MSFEQRQDDTEREKECVQCIILFYSIKHTAIFENVVPIADKNIRVCFSIIICGDANAHQVEEIKSMIGEINGRLASANVRL